MATTNSLEGPRVLVIAGSDSSGGAGLQRDVAVLAGVGVRAACVVTAITSQSDTAMRASFPVPCNVVSEQFGAAIEGPISAIKVGMLGTLDCVKTVSALLAQRASCHPEPALPLVLDPVLRASSGGELLAPPAIEVLLRELSPLATLITPNLAEAAVLLGAKEARSETEQAEQATALAAQLRTGVLLKGGHARGAKCVDILARPGHKTVSQSLPRLGASMRGTGCALSSLIAAHLARGAELAGACRSAQLGVAALLATSSGLLGDVAV